MKSKSRWGPTKEKECTFCHKTYMGMGQAKYCESCVTAQCAYSTDILKRKKYWKEAIKNEHGYGPRSILSRMIVAKKI